MKLLQKMINAMAALAGEELKKQIDERPVRFRLELERIELGGGKPVIIGTFAPDFPEVGMAPSHSRGFRIPRP